MGRTISIFAPLDSLNTILFDDNAWEQLLPLTLTKPVAHLRIGISTIAEKWQHLLDAFPEEISYLTQDYLSIKYKLRLEEDNLFLNGSVVPNVPLLQQIQKLLPGQGLIRDKKLIAFRSAQKSLEVLHKMIKNPSQYLILTSYTNDFLKIQFPWDIFTHNSYVIKEDFKSLTAGLNTDDIPLLNTIIGNEDDLFIETEEEIEGVFFNTKNGPIYVGSGVKILEGSMLRGPLAICENAVVKMGAKIYGGTTIGPFSKVGGELSNVVIQGYSNKGHDGYLGNSVIGEWCNLGADTNCSNLKNNYSFIKVWQYPEQDSINTGLQFCGLIMGDHSKSSINTMFNTGTVVGVSANIFGAGFPPKFVPSFSWGFETPTVYQFDKAMETVERVMNRRHITLNNTDRDILRHIFDHKTTL